MLRIEIIVIGKMKEKWMREGLAEYEKRIAPYAKLTITELAEYRLPENPSEAEIQKGLYEEGVHILQKANRDYLCPLCVEGTLFSSEELAALLRDAARQTGNITFIIGGSFGLSEEVKRAGRKKLSFSRMTFPHQLMRVVLLEQIYRALSINAGGKYHK